MISNVLMPKLGLVMKKGRIIKWYKRVGDFVKEGEPLFQISTEKVTIDVEAKVSGFLRIIYAQPGSIVPVSGIIGLMGDKDDPLPDIKPPVYEINTKDMDVTIVKNNVRTGLNPVPNIDNKSTGQISSSSLFPREEDGFKDIKASPAAKRLAKEKGINLAMVKGTGPGGRITEVDITNFHQEETKHMIAQDSQIPSTPYARKLIEEHDMNIEQIAQSTGDRKIYAQDVINTYKSTAATVKAGSNEQSTLLPLTDLRSAVADRMSYSVHTVAPVTLSMEVVAEEVLRLKDAMSLTYPSDKVTINDILIKLVALAITKHPLANASLEESGIRIYHVVNIGIGVAIEGGLIVPAIADADKKSIVQISRESKDLIERAKTGRLTLEELSRGTFTITNLGAYGIDMFTPIINPPQSATLGIGRIVKKPWVIDDKIGIVSTMVLSLTFDHRIIDGAPAAQCLMTIKQYLENPYTVLGA